LKKGQQQIASLAFCYDNVLTVYSCCSAFLIIFVSFLLRIYSKNFPSNCVWYIKV